MSAWVVALCLLGQVDGGLSPPPAPPEAAPEGAVYPRVIRVPGKVCVESLDEAGAVRTDCRLEEEDYPTQRKPAPEKEPPSRMVANLGVLGGALLVGVLVPELAFTADVGVRFRNGVGVVGLLHGHVTALVGRYGLGAGLRLGDRSHVVIGASTSLLVFNNHSNIVGLSATLLARFAIVFAKYFTVLLMPTLTFDGSGAIASLSAGLGLTF